MTSYIGRKSSAIAALLVTSLWVGFVIAGGSGGSGSCTSSSCPGGGGEAADRQNIEEVMRKLAARLYVASGQPATWPECTSSCASCSGGSETAHSVVSFPEDNYYGKKLSHHQQMSLVSAVIAAWNDEDLRAGWVKNEPENNFPSEDVAVITETLTLENYPDLLKEVSSRVDKLKYRLAPSGTITLVDGTRKSTTGGHTGSDCEEAKDSAQSHWNGASWNSYSGGPYVVEYSFTQFGAYYEAFKEIAKGKVSCDLTQYEGFDGEVTSYLKLSSSNSGHNPPVTADNTWRSWSALGAKLGETKTSSEFPSISDVDWSFDCPGDEPWGKDWGYVGTKVLIEFKFDDKSDPGNCGEGSGSCSSGSSSGGVGCMSYSLDLGKATADKGAGRIFLSEEIAFGNLSKRKRLKWVTSSDDPSSPVDVITTTGNVLRQIKTPTGLFDIVDDGSNPYKYYIRFYEYGHFGTTIDGSGIYPIDSGEEGDWDREITVVNPDYSTPPLTTFNRLEITERTGGAPGTIQNKYLYAYDDVTDTWEMSSGWDGSAYARWEAITKTWNGGNTQRTETFVVRNTNSSGTIVQHRTRVYQVFDWGEEIISEAFDVDGNPATTTDQRVTTWTYYDDEVNDGDNYSRLEKYKNADGYWEKYTYDSLNRVTKIIAQYQNLPDTATEAQSKVTEYTYTYADILDGDGEPGTNTTNDLRTRIVEKLNSVEQSRRYTIAAIGTLYNFEWDIKTEVGGDWDDVTNQVTVTKSVKYNGTTNQGRPVSVVQANGDLSELYHTSVYTYGGTYSDGNFPGVTLEVRTVESGIPSALETVSFGTKTITRLHPLGAIVFSETYPINSGTVDTGTKISSEIVEDSGDLDEFGRVLRTEYLDGTTAETQYGCCNIEARTDRQGIVTTYVYDELDRVIASTRASSTSGALTMLYTYDADGNVLTVKRKGTDNVERTVETNVYDAAGRLTKRTDAAGKKTHYVYKSVTDSGKTYQETRVYPHGINAGPVQVSWADGEGRVVRSFTASATPDWSSSAPSGTETLTELSRTENEYECCGNLAKARVYHNLGSSLYYETSYVYDDFDRLIRTTDGIGNIAATVYDSRGRAVSEWRGTDATGATAADPSNGGANNMAKVSETFYDTDRDGTGDDRPFVTRVRQLKPASTLQYVNIDYDYDSKRRLEWSKPAVGPWSKRVYDVMGRVTESITYQNGSTTYILAKAATVYDSVGRVSESQVYEVDGAGALTGKYLLSSYSYDDASRQVKVTSPQGGYTKTLFDMLGRAHKTAVASSEGIDTDPDTLVGDTVLVEQISSYDDVDNVIQITRYVRNHDASATGPLESSAGSARITYSAAWYDEAYRPVLMAEYGTNGDSALSDYDPATSGTQDHSAAASTLVPNSHDDVLVSKTVYDSAGNLKDTVDNKGITARREYDAMGRVTKLTENYLDGTPGDDNDRITLYTYNADGQVVTQTADMPSGTDDQVTKYIYSSELTDKGCIVKSNSYLRAVIYPDSDDVVSSSALSNGTDTTHDRVEMTYYADGSLATRKDPRGVTLTFSYDDAGRRTAQAVTSGTVSGDQQIKYTYTDLGWPEKITGYSVVDTTVSNEVQLEYNGLGQVTKEYQEHSGAVNTGTSLKVQYAYDSTVASNVFTKGMRSKYMTYPNGREVHRVYDGHSGIDDATSRVSKISDGSSGSPSTTLVSYSLMGDGRSVRKDYTTPEVRLDLWGGSSDTYAGIDRFGRTTDHRWHDYGASSDADRFGHAHDRASNRMYRENTLTSGKDEYYTYDSLHRLSNMDRGDLNGTKDAITGTPAKEEDWTLSAVGNWSGFVQKTLGTTDLNQSRTHNTVNEITAISETVGTAWAEPAHDAAGNMATIPKPSDLANSYTAIYDAWNRLVEVKEGSNTVAKYKYDGAGRRIVKETYASGVLDETRHFHYTLDWQVIEERVNGRTNPAERQYVWGINYVDELALRDRDTGDDGTLEERLFALQDANHNVTSICDTSGTMVERFTYTPYGVRTIHDGSFGSRSSSSYDWNVGHQGLMHDDETRLVYNRERILHPSLGRFVRRDPLGYVDGMSTYAYLRSSPLNMFDPIGTKANTCQIAVVPGVAPKWDSQWRYVRTDPGSMVSAGAGGAGGADFRAYYVKLYFELVYCCDSLDFGYFRWVLRGVLGYAESGTVSGHPTVTVGVPVPIPIGYGQVIDIGEYVNAPSWTGWGGPAPNWAGRPATPGTILPVPPLKPSDISGNPDLELIPSVTCCGGLASNGAGANIPGPPAGVAPPAPPKFP